MAMFVDTGGYVLEHLQDTMVFIANYGGSCNDLVGGIAAKN